MRASLQKVVVAQEIQEGEFQGADNWLRKEDTSG